MSEGKILAVGVSFKERAYWSKAYTYRSKVPYRVGEAVVVPTGEFYGIGRVTFCKDEYEWDPDINYKNVVGAVAALVPKDAP